MTNSMADERERCAKIVESFPMQVLVPVDRPGGPSGNHYRATTRADIAAAIRNADGDQMADILEDLIDLHKQATTERSHYYVAKTAERAIAEINLLRTRPPMMVPAPSGCVCPVGAEGTCQGFSCPRRKLTIT